MEEFVSVNNINVISAYVAAQEAVASFKKVPDAAAKAFIYTGNITNAAPIPGFLTQGMGKSAAVHLIESAATAYAYRGFKDGLRFLIVIWHDR